MKKKLTAAQRYKAALAFIAIGRGKSYKDIATRAVRVARDALKPGWDKKAK